MKSIYLNKSFSCSPLGVGVMRYNPQDYETLIKNIDYSIEHGVNYFETCYFYLNYTCESFLSQALLRHNRTSYNLIDKMPVRLTQHIPPEEIFKNQLKNCQTDYFDGYLLQALDRNTINLIDEYDLINFIHKKKEQGIINQIGFSFHDNAEYLEYYLKLYDWDYIQLQLNYYDWFLGNGKELYEIAKKHDINIVAMGPLKGGTLVKNLPSEAIKLLNNFDFQRSTASWGIKFLQSLSNVKVILTGAESLPMLKENIALFEEPFTQLTQQEMDILKKVINFYKEKNYINCNECGYCKCTQNIDIKETFSLYNQALKNSLNLNNFRDFLKTSNNDPLECIHCRYCEQFCPQHLPISDYMYEKIFQLRA